MTFCSDVYPCVINKECEANLYCCQTGITSGDARLLLCNCDSLTDDLFTFKLELIPGLLALPFGSAVATWP